MGLESGDWYRDLTTRMLEDQDWILDAVVERLELRLNKASGCQRLESGCWRLEPILNNNIAGGLRLEAGTKTYEQGCWRARTVGWRLEAGGC